jgi:hypothetical protein
MIVAVAALLVAAALSVGLRATSGWLEHWHPIDRLILAMILGGVVLAASLTMSSRYGVIQAGYGLAFSLAPVGLYDVLKWWFRSRGRRASWLLGATAAGWVVALRWLFLVAMVGGLAALAAAPPAQ